LEWQLQQAKAKFSQLVQMAVNEGPQFVTRRRNPEVVVAADEFERMKQHTPTLKQLLLSSGRSKASLSSDRSITAARSSSDVLGRHRRDLRGAAPGSLGSKTSVEGSGRWMASDPGL
jgi:prevent-host-death family protein